MNQHVRRAEALKQTLDRRLAKHANARLAQFGEWFARHYPRHHIRVEMYVMGMDDIQLNGGVLDVFCRPGLLHVKGHFSHHRMIDGPLVDELRQTLKDVEDITSNGEYGHPDPLEVGTPRISRFKRKKGA